MTKKKATAKKKTVVEIEPPKIEEAVFTIIGTAPYVQNKFSAKAKQILHDKHEAGSTAKKNMKKAPKDFSDVYEQAIHRMADGTMGIPAPAFRCAMISACKIVGYAMTRAKLSIFIKADGFDAEDGTPLVKFTKGKPTYSEMPVRIAKGTIDLRARPMWREGWEAKLRVNYDADQFTTDDVANLLMRVGLQVGIGEGRPDSKNSSGMGWGTFTIAS